MKMHEPGVEIFFPSPFSLFPKAGSRKPEILPDGGWVEGSRRQEHPLLAVAMALFEALSIQMGFDTGYHCKL